MREGFAIAEFACSNRSDVGRHAVAAGALEGTVAVGASPAMPWSSSRSSRLALLASVAAMVAGAAAVNASVASVAAGQVEAAESSGCAPQMMVLPPLQGAEDSSLVAINDRGWAVGTSGERVVLWRDGEVVDLGIGSRLTTEVEVHARPIDVNENGMVAVAKIRVDRNDGIVRLVRRTAWLWKNGQATRLPAGRVRTNAVPAAVNDYGTAVGYITRGENDSRPALWRDGELTRLPLPRSATSGYAEENNNHGLIIGSVFRRDEPATPWYWRVRGSSGPLQTPQTRRPVGVAPTDVDNRDRIVGAVTGGDGVVWREPTAKPRMLGFPAPDAINDYGDVVGTSGGLRGIGEKAWVARLASDTVHALPYPPNTGDEGGTVYAREAIRGVTSFAPHGGVSVGGGYSGNTDKALIWTCAYQQ